MPNITRGEWFIKKEKIVDKLPNIHVMGGIRGDLYLASIHETHVRGEDKLNANLMSAAKDMYEAITMGLTGKDLDGNPVDNNTVVAKMITSKAKAEGKDPEKALEKVNDEATKKTDPQREDSPEQATGETGKGGPED